MGIKVFTIEEANRLLPGIEQAIRELQEDVRGIVATQDALAVLDMLDGSTPASPEHADFLIKQNELDDRIQAYNSRLEDIQGQGCVIKDLNHGIVDFYGLKEGRLVFLCWRLGEPSIRFWHEINSGMAGRRPVSEL